MRADGIIREIVFDTETTGFDARGNDRITEIGAIEVIDFMPTGRSFHAYLDPQREVPDKVVELTGLTTEFLPRDIKVDYVVPVAKPRPNKLPMLSTPQERAAHSEYVRSLGGEMVWYRYDVSAD